MRSPRPRSHCCFPATEACSLAPHWPQEAQGLSQGLGPLPGTCLLVQLYPLPWHSPPCADLWFSPQRGCMPSAQMLCNPVSRPLSPLLTAGSGIPSRDPPAWKYRFSPVFPLCSVPAPRAHSASAPVEFFSANLPRVLCSLRAAARPES